MIVGFYAPATPLEREIDLIVPVARGSIIVRLYSPADYGAPVPCHLYFHGGGFWLGTLDHFDPVCRGLAREAGCAVASVAYRLAPEHKFPTAPEDCYSALLWIQANANELGLDPMRLSVGGLSAGGNLAAVVALMARDRGGPAIAAQVLELPVTNFTDLEPLPIPGEGVTMPTGKEEYMSHYLKGSGDAAHPYASPALAKDLSGLPPALILCAEYDGLRPDGEAYAQQLAAAGVSADMYVCQGQFHGAQQMAALIPNEAAEYQARIAQMLRQSFGMNA